MIMSKRDDIPEADSFKVEKFRRRTSAFSWKAEGIRPRQVLTFHSNLTPKEGQLVVVILDGHPYIAKFIRFDNEGVTFSNHRGM
jgi:hypothetical protein